MQWCLPFRRQHSGTEADSHAVVRGASVTPQSTAINEFATSRLNMMSVLVLVNHFLRLLSDFHFRRMQHVAHRLRVDNDTISDF